MVLSYLMYVFSKIFELLSGNLKFVFELLSCYLVLANVVGYILVNTLKYIQNHFTKSGKITLLDDI